MIEELLSILTQRLQDTSALLDATYCSNPLTFKIVRFEFE
jgi:hypothetical protein